MPNPFPELRPFDTADRRPPAPGPLNAEPWLEREMRADRNRQLRTTIDNAPGADETARATRVARQAGVPPLMVQDRLSEAEKGLNAQSFVSLADRYPAIGHFAASNPRGAVAAQDDSESLGLLGNAWEGLKNLGYRLGAGAVESVAGLLDEPAVPTPITLAERALDLAGGDRNALRDLRRMPGAAIRPTASRLREKGRAENWWAETALTGVEFVPVTVAAAFTRNARLATAIPAMAVRGGSVAEARSQGMAEPQAQLYGSLQGGLEFATERIPAGFLVDAIVKRTPFGKAFARQLLSELPGEQVATATQDFVDWAMLPENEDKTFGDYVAARPDAALSTLVATGGGVTATTVGVKAIQRGADVAGRVAETVGLAQRALQERRFFEGAMKAAGASKLRTRDPEAFRELVRQQAEEAGATHVYIPGDAIRSYHQSDSYDRQDDPFARYDAEEAIAAGGDVVIPIEDALTDLVGTPAWQAVQHDARLTPGGLSKSEAEAFSDAMDDVLADLGDKAAEQDRAEVGERSVREKLVERVAEMFGESFTSPVARNIAELFAQRVQTRAARLGQEVTGEELGDFEVRQDLGPAKGRVFTQSVEDQGGRRAQAALIDPATPVGVLELANMPERTQREAKDALAAIVGEYATATGETVSINKKVTAKALSGFANATKRSLVGEFPAILAASAVYSSAGDYSYAASHVRLNGVDHAVRLVLKKAGDGKRKLYQLEGFEIAEGGQTISTPDGKSGARSASATPRTVADLIEVFNRQPPGAFPAFQSAEAGPRGQIEFDQGRRIIKLFASRNLSTPLHELSHMWLEELRFDASLSDAPEQVRADWETVQRYFAANGHALGEDGQIPTDAHELWARSGERYFMEGKAPTSALVRLFETFRSWLLNIYKTVDALRAPISPEIREVFDRLLATDEEISAAQERQGLAALFKDAASVGMTEPEFNAYQRQVDDTRAGAHASLLDKTMQTLRRREEARYSDARKRIRTEETERVDAAPLFKALATMKEQRVSKEWIVEEFGEDALALLPVRVPPLYVSRGVHPDLTAEQSGYGSGKEMLEAVIGAEKAHRAAKEGGDARSMRQRAIETATDEEFARRYGDPLNDGSIEREALAAVHSEMQGEVIASELRVLSRKTGRRPTPYAIAREWARGKVRSGEVRQGASPSAIQRYARNAAKAGREAEAAMLKGDVDETFRQKQFQMMNNALVAEAKAAHDEVQSAVRRMDKVARAKTRDSVDPDYFEQAQALLETVDLRKRSQASIDRKQSFEKWAASRPAGEEVYIPEAFDWSGTPWSRMTVEALIGLDDTIKSILHLGRRKKELLIGKEKRDWHEARGEWLGGAENLPERPMREGRNTPRNKLRGLFSNLIRIDMMSKVMDGGDPNGLMTRVLAHGSKEADNTYARVHKQVMEPLIAAYMAMKGNRLHNRVTVPEWNDYATGQPTTFLRADLLAIALNFGNESSLRKMIAGEALLFKGQEHLAPTAEGVLRALHRELNEDEWKLVETAGRTVNSLFPEIAETERELTGITPEQVEPRKVVTPYGEIEGWYWPVVFDSDPVRAADAGVHLAELKQGDLETTLGLTGRGISTAKGHTITRTDFVAPMFLNFEGVLFGHVNQVAKRIAYQSWATQALKVIRDPRIKAMWARKLGPEYHSQLEPWLRDTVNQGITADSAHTAEFSKVLKAARMNLTVMGLVGRITTLVAQVGGLTSSINAIGARNLLNGLGICAANYGATKARIYETSPLMARRINEFDRDQLAALAELQRPRSTAVSRALKPLADIRDRWNALGFHAIGAIQLHLVDLPTWAGAYAQATAATDEGGLDMGHDRAVAYADLKVEQAQGAGRTAQLAAIQRAGEASRIMTLFYTFFGTQLNYQWEMSQDLRRGDVRKAAKSAFWIMVATPLLAGLLHDAVAGGLPDDDDDDTWLAWMMRKVFFGMFTGVPVVRDFANQAERSAAGKYSPSPETPWQRIGSGITGGGSDAFAAISQTDWYREAEDLMPLLPDPTEVSDRWVKHSIEALGFATGTGTGQIATTGQFVADVASGDARPTTVGDYVEGTATGRVE